MMKPLLAAALLLALAAPADAVMPLSETQLMERAVAASLAKDGSPCAKRTRLKPGLRVGAWARATITCPGTDDATVYLRHDRRGWTVVTLGTGWAPDELAKLGVPAAMR